MNRSIALVASAILLSCGPAARGQWEKYPPAMKKLMPKDQLEIFEKAEAIAELHHSLLFRIKDAKKRDEENEKLGAQSRELQETIVKKLKTEGLKGWIGTCDIYMPKNAVVLDSWQPIRISLKMRDKGPVGKVEEALSDLKVFDIVRYSTKADATYTLPKALGKGWAGFDQLIKVDTIVSVEKVGTKPKPGAKK
jgi:hypothetical protein